MYTRHLTKELKEKARQQLNEENREECLNDVVQWALEKYTLKFGPDDLWLLNFARSCKFNSSNVKKRLDTYIDVKVSVPEIFGNRDPLLPQIQEILKTNCVVSFSTPDKDCMLLRWNVLNEKRKVTDVVKICGMLFDDYMRASETCMIVGQHVIVDFEGFSLGFLRQVTPMFLRNVFCYFMYVHPWRIKGLYFINTSKLLEKWFNFGKFFMSEDLKLKTNAYGTDYNEIFASIPRQYFPKEYGGNSKSVENMAALLRRRLEDNREWYLKNSLNECNNHVSSKSYIKFNKMFGLFSKDKCET